MTQACTAHGLCHSGLNNNEGYTIHSTQCTQKGGIELSLQKTAQSSAEIQYTVQTSASSKPTAEQSVTQQGGDSKHPQVGTRAFAGDDLTIKQLLDRIRRSVQGAFANSELPTGEQTVMAGLPEEDEPKLMPFGFAVHDESFFLVPEWHGLQVRSVSRATHTL